MQTTKHEFILSLKPHIIKCQMWQRNARQVNLFFTNVPSHCVATIWNISLSVLTIIRKAPLLAHRIIVSDLSQRSIRENVTSINGSALYNNLTIHIYKYDHIVLF